MFFIRTSTRSVFSVTPHGIEANVSLCWGIWTTWTIWWASIAEAHVLIATSWEILWYSIIKVERPSWKHDFFYHFFVWAFFHILSSTRIFCGLSQSCWTITKIPPFSNRNQVDFFLEICLNSSDPFILVIIYPPKGKNRLNSRVITVCSKVHPNVELFSLFVRTNLDWVGPGGGLSLEIWRANYGKVQPIFGIAEFELGNFSTGIHLVDVVMD